ncbi:MAG: IS256-like element ISEfm2 family transposase [Myxococcota bacterium]
MRNQIVINSLPEALEIIKEMDLKGLEWGKDNYRTEARYALKQILEDGMDDDIEGYLSDCDEDDRRNGYYTRHLLTELGDIELSVPRTRRYSAFKVVKAYSRRSRQVDSLILACFVLGISTRKVSEALMPILGEPVSATTVSRVARVLDDAVFAFHRRPLSNQYKALLFDGVVLSRKTGAGAIRRPVLVALGIREDGKKEVIDFRLATSESEAEWEQFLTDLYNRGLRGEGSEILCIDGGKGLHSAIGVVYPNIPVQRCWAHKIRNITDKVKKRDRGAVKRDAHKVMNAKNKVEARKAAGEFKRKWEDTYPRAVECLRNDLDDLLNFLNFPEEKWRKATRTTNAIERRFREVRRRTRPMGVFSDKTSIERILFAVFTHENKSQGVNSPFLLTQNS